MVRFTRAHAETEAGPQVVERAADKDDVCRDLSDHGCPFPTYRDALAVPATLGWRQKRQVPSGKAAGEPSRWSTMTNRFGRKESR